jgi:uncharacterized SAM-binding protein YcdF (DUF218 family)
MRFLIKLLRVCLFACGTIFIVGTIWTAAGGPLLFDRLLIKNEPPQKADYIVCVTGGLSGDFLPTEDGWRRIYTSVQLYLDGYAPKIIFSGGGSAKVTEAEIYAEAAGWLGCPPGDVICEPGAGSTADHPEFLLRSGRRDLTKESRLNIVTTPLHSCRTAGVFRKAGFRRVRIVSAYTAQKVNDPTVVRSLRTSRYPGHFPSGKRYDDVFNRLKWGTDTLFTSLREVAAVISYKIKGKI